jgi:2-oxo-4-hydroxy-4-carboxy-5-ureidoimidazoline decarboxylase
VTGTTTERQRLRWLNELPAERAVAELLAVCHSRGWAQRVAYGRPYPDAALQRTADEVWTALGPQGWREALVAHPRIGEQGGGSAPWSRREQAGVGGAAPEVRAALARGNAAYEDRFGHVFLIAAAGRSADDILADLRARLGNDPDTELRVAADEHRRITRLRLARLLGG